MKLKINNIEVTAFNYNNGVDGFMAKENGREINLTVNLLDNKTYHKGILLKMWGDAEQINHKLLEILKRIGWERTDVVSIGYNKAIFIIKTETNEKSK